jgi:aspartyl-tRNA(Asn)/glutamyl-tRNA(Gln) amidotransferase subunit A
MPATIGPAPGTGTTGDPAFNSPWSYLGWPAVSFPIGLSPDGLPLAIQLVGRTSRVEHDLLKTASWCEDVIRRDFRASASARSD